MSKAITKGISSKRFNVILFVWYMLLTDFKCIY